MGIAAGQRGRRWWMAAALALSLGLGVNSAAAQEDLRPERERAREVLDRTEEVLGRVAEAVREADIPKARDLLEDAYQLEKRAELLLDQTDGISSRSMLLTRLRQSISLSLRARDLGVRAGQVLREQVTLQRKTQRELEQVRSQLDRVRQQAAEDPEALDLLRRVDSQLERAETQMRDGDFEVALRLAQTARALLRSAVPEGPGASPRDRYLGELERTRGQVQRMRNQLEGSDPQFLLRLDEVTGMLDRSETQFRQGRIRAARGLLVRARDELADLRVDASLRPSEPEIRRAVERVERALRDLDEVIDSSAPTNVQRMLERARQAHRRTVQALEKGEVETAVRHHRVSVDLVTRLRSWVDEQSD